MTERILNTPEEVDLWHPVPNHEGRLEVTRSGAVRGCDRTVRSRYGSTRRIKARILKPNNIRGYFCVQVLAAGKPRNVFIHRMIAELFVPNPHGKPYVNHIDGNKANNKIENLEWVTHAENMRHAFALGLVPYPKSGPGDQSPAAKLDWPSVREIRRLLSEGSRHIDVANQFGVTKGTIGFIARNETWRVAL